MLASPARGDRPATTNADGRSRGASLHVSRRPDGRGARAARARHGHARHVLAEGLHPADEALPRRLPLLHVRAAAAPRRASVHDARTRCSRSRGRAPRRAAREALFTLGDKPELRYRVAARRAGRARLRDDARVPRALRAARARRDRAAAAPQPGRDDRARSSRRCGPVAASMGLMLETTADRLAARGGPHWASPDKLPARRLETMRLAGELRVPFTSGDPDRHRRDARGAARRAARDAGARRASTGTCRR